MSPQITGTASPDTVKTLVMSNPTTLLLSKNLFVSDTLHHLRGEINMNSKKLKWGSYCYNESVTLSDVQDLNAPDKVEPGELGIVISSTANLGSTKVTRGFTSFNIDSMISIRRWYSIEPQNNSGLTATLIFRYEEAELNDIDEAELSLYRSTDNGNSWVEMGGVVNSDSNFVTLTGIDAFSLWTLSRRVGVPLSVEKGNLVPKELTLNNYPNPFNPQTIVEFTVPSDAHVVLKVFNYLGQLVETLYSGNVKAGEYHRYRFGATHLASGVYYAVLETNGQRIVKKMLLFK